MIIAFILYKRQKKLIIIPILFLTIGIGVSNIHIEHKNRSDYTCVVYECKPNYFLASSKLEKFYIPLTDHYFEIGDVINVKGKVTRLDFEVIESSFDFEKFLNKKGVKKQLKIYDWQYKFKCPFRINAFRKKYLSNFSEENASFINKLMFSNNTKSDLVKEFNNSQLNRVISASGLYIYALIGLFNTILSRFLSEKKTKIVDTIFLSLYFIITFPRFSVFRILILHSFSLINLYLLNNKISYLNRVACVGLTFLILNPYLAYQYSFILGFLIPITAYFIRGPLGRAKWWSKHILFSISIFIFVIPFMIKFGNKINLLALPIQTLLFPIMLLNNLVNIICFFKIPLYGVSDFLYHVLSNLSSPLLNTSLFIRVPALNDISIIIYYTIYFLFFYYLEIGFKPCYQGCLVAFLALSSIYSLPLENVVTREVSFINVGQGDSCLIRNGKTTVLIDTGGSLYRDVATDCLIPFFSKKRIYKIDLVITTHDDHDHNGALPSLREHFHVKNIITDRSHFPLDIGGIHLENMNVFDGKDDNDKSIVTSLDFMGKRFLMMGDASIEIERQFIKKFPNYTCDILKAGHHGSNTSTCPEFIRSIKPKEAIISTGKNNYGHPFKSVLDTLTKYDVKILRTDYLGTITYSNFIF